MKLTNIDLEKLIPENLSSVTKMERRSFLKMGLVITGVFAGGRILSVTSNVSEVFASLRDFV
jgi:protein NrfC